MAAKDETTLSHYSDRYNGIRKYVHKHYSVTCPPSILTDEEHSTDDRNIIQGFHHDVLDSFPLFDGYPSHLHIDLLPKAQGTHTLTSLHQPTTITYVLPLGQGNGSRMSRHIERELKQRGLADVHLGELSTVCFALVRVTSLSLLGMAPSNTRAFHFYTKLGFEVVTKQNNTLWLSQHLT